MSCHLGPAFPGKQSFPVTADTHRSLACIKVSKVPRHLSDNKIPFIQAFTHGLIKSHLVLFREHLRHRAVQSGDAGFRRQYPDWGTREFWRRETADFRIQLENIRRALDGKDYSWNR